jgi:hypothetical protein
LVVVFLAGAFFAAVVFPAAVFFAVAFLAGAFFAAVVFFAVVFFAVVFLAGAFLAGAFLVVLVDAALFVPLVFFAVAFLGVAFFADAADFVVDAVDPPDVVPLLLVARRVTPEVTRFAAAAVFPASFFAVERAMAAGPPVQRGCVAIATRVRRGYALSAPPSNTCAT